MCFILIVVITLPSLEAENKLLTTMLIPSTSLISQTLEANFPTEADPSAVMQTDHSTTLGTEIII